jgi:hypothetical protein
VEHSLQTLWPNLQRAETLMIFAAVGHHRAMFQAYLDQVNLEESTRSLLIRLACGFDPDRLCAADYFSRYPFSSLSAIQAGLDHLAGQELVVAKGSGHYALTGYGKDTVHGWFRAVETMIEALDLGGFTPQDAARLLDYDRRILDGIRAAVRPHGHPIFRHRLRGLHPSYEPPALWHHWQYVCTMLAASEDEEEYVRDQRRLAPLVWFARRQIWFVHRRPWRARVRTVEDLARRATGYSPLDRAEEACAQAVRALEAQGWVEATDGELRLTAEGLAITDRDEDEIDRYFLSCWPGLSGDEVEELGDLVKRLNDRWEELIAQVQ